MKVFWITFQKGDPQDGLGKTVITRAESLEHENSSIDPDEAIRQRLAELRANDSCKDKGDVICNIIIMLGSPEITLSILIGSYLVCILLHDYFTKAGKIPTKTSLVQVPDYKLVTCTNLSCSSYWGTFLLVCFCTDLWHSLLVPPWHSASNKLSFYHFGFTIDPELFSILFTDNSSISQITDQQLGERFENLTGRKAISMQNSNVNNIWIKCQCYHSFGKKY